MPLQLTGPISLADIAAEFSDTPPYSLSEYYGKADGIPATGLISMGAFYGKSSMLRTTLSTNTQQLNLRTYMLSLGWNGTQAVEFTIATGVYVWSDNTSVAALDMGGSFPGGLTLINNGFIIGKGGNGGTGLTTAGTYSYTSPPTAGGLAINLTGPITIDNTNGYIGGGGGGGAAGWSESPSFFGTALLSPGGGGAGGGLGGVFTSDNTATGPATATSPTPPGPGGLGSSTLSYRQPVNATYGVPTLGTSGGAGGSGGVSYYQSVGGSV